MTKVLIVSDSHGLRTELIELRERYQQDIDLFLHCGDSELSTSDQELQNYHTVRGNCDYDASLPTELIKRSGGLLFFVTHGHLHQVKSSLTKLAYRAEEVGANIVCFGHSHELGAELVNGKLYINPGSLLLPRGRTEKTYILLHIDEETITLSVYNDKHEELTHLQTVFNRDELS